jgi:hypothetical protein
MTMKKKKREKETKSNVKGFLFLNFMTCNDTILMTLTAQDAKKGQ